jgi:hypothetical protein
MIRTITLHPLLSLKRACHCLLLLGILQVGAGCGQDGSTPEGGGGAGGEGSDLNDSTCGTSALLPLNVVELEIVEGSPPKAKGGEVRPGTYELTEWRVWLDPVPTDMPTTFLRTQIALDEDGTFRLSTKDQTGAAIGSGRYSASEKLFSFIYNCPGNTTPEPTPYSATEDTLTLLKEDGQEYFYRRLE